MGRRVFYAEPVQPLTESVHVVDFRPAIELAGELIPSDNSVDVTIRERESGADVTGSMLVPGSVRISDNVCTFRRRGGSDNYEYIATMRARTNLRPSGGPEADVVIPVAERPRRTFSAVGP